MRLVATIAATLIKLVFALAILAVGVIVFAPAWTARWSVAPILAPFIARLISILPVDRSWWGVLVLALGVATFLAALPKKTVGRSRGRTPAALQPAAEQMSFGPQDVETLHLEPVLVEASSVTAVEPTHTEETIEHAAARAPWDFPAAHPVSTAEAAPIEPQAPPVHPPADLTATPASDEPHPERGEPDAITSHEDALAAAHAAARDAPGVHARSQLADLLKKSGDIEESEGRLGPAIEAYEQSLALRREVVGEDPENAREVRWLWMTLETLAECRDDRGHHTQAAALYRESLATGERALALAPDDVTYAKDLAATRARLAALEAQTTA